MSSHRRPRSPQPNDDDVALLRQELAHILPKDLDTDCNLARWHKAYAGDRERIRRHFADYVEARAAAGFDVGEGLLERVYEYEVSRKYLPYLSLSRLDERAFNARDAAIVYVQHLRSIDMHRVLRFVTMSDWLRLFFVSNEYNLQLVLRKERQLGRHVSMQLVFDLGGFHVADYLNPFCAPLKCARYMAHIWLSWYSELIHSIVVTNAPALVSKLWALISPFLPATHRARVHFTADHGEVLALLGGEPAVVPACFEGGMLRDDSGWSAGRETECVNQPRLVGEDELQSVGKLWAERNLVPKLTKHSIKSGKTFTIMRTFRPGERSAELLWQFTVNGDVTFHAFYMPHCDEPQSSDSPAADKLAAWCDLDGTILKRAVFGGGGGKPADGARWIEPKLLLSTPVLAEQKCIPLDSSSAGVYCLHFENAGSSWFAVQLEYDVRIVAVAE